MKLKYIIPFTIVALLLSVSSAPISASVGIIESQPIEDEIVPQYTHSYSKTVKKAYSVSSASHIPTSIYYSEYNSGFNATFSGTLSLASVQKLGDNYVATYTGTLTGSWN
ncbi:TPA: hypothetical protein TXJ05_000691 [Streptococcus suis]|nr:hypothetical protein [Streptococcus suis]